jgi:hypothetical protein
MALIAPLLGATALAATTWGLVEARAIVVSERRLPIPNLDARLRGLRIAHLSDFHLGAPGFNRAVALRAADLVMDYEPDLIAITGDLMSHPRGAAALREVCARLEAPLGVFACLGNHDVGDVRDPLSRPGGLPDPDVLGITILEDETVVVERFGATIAITGLAPVRPEDLGDDRVPPPADADLEVILAHYPEVFDRIDPDRGCIVLAGHLHGGQICVPHPAGRVRLSQRGRRFTEGVYHREHVTMHLSRGTGTTFVPFRVLARPEATLLVLGDEGAN